ncbi:MAG: nucleoside triphosphate pyrophosphohydrolase [Acidobacteriia bacterium]|nr:nucleoside triphosphate pyrophosphohydrolase [Terriglobia bacterium]
MKKRHSKLAPRKRAQRAVRRSSKPAPAKPRKSLAAAAPGQWFEKLVALQARLRAPGGCPWDREQTHSTLRTYLIEEAYEVLEALESGDDAKFAGELGDLLLQVVFHSQIAQEQGRFSSADVIRLVHDKMLRRHPHVFWEVQAGSSGEVLRNWEQIKAEERKEQRSASDGEKRPAPPPSLLDGVPQNAPAALEAFQLTRRAARIGFDWENAEGILEKWQEEAAELRHAREAGHSGQIEEEVGDLLFVAVNLARFLHVDPEIALKKANRKFSSRFRGMEKLAASRGSSLAHASREDLERLWDASKLAERAAARSAASSGKGSR